MRYDAVLFDNGGTLTHRSVTGRGGRQPGRPVRGAHLRGGRRSLLAPVQGAQPDPDGGETAAPQPVQVEYHRTAYVNGYAPFEEIAPGLADLMYDEWKTNPQTMVPYPDTPPVLKSFASAGIPIGIVSNTGWSIHEGYAATGLDGFIQTFVLSCDLGIAKPDPEPFQLACDRLGVSPDRTLMVGNNRLADSGSICIGCYCLILPPVPPGATRGLRAAADVAEIPWAE